MKNRELIFVKLKYKITGIRIPVSRLLTISTFLLILSALLLGSCQEKVVNKFESDNSLFFFRGSSNSKGLAQIDSLSYSFFLAGSAVEDTTWLDVYLTGFPSDRDRTIPLVQTNAGQPGAAVEGIHYVPFNDPGMVSKLILPANKVWVSIPIVIKRTSEMDTQEFRLDMSITSNEFFVTGIKDRTDYTLKITALAVKPALWDNLNSFLSIFGTWGQVKMRFIIDYVGYSEFDVIPNVDYRTYLRLKAKAKLAEYEAVNGPLYELDGVTRVIFP
jgi:hypothetical protein